MTKVSHRGVLEQLSEEYDLKRQFLEAIAPTRDEKRKTTLLHAIAGKPPEKTGRTLCQFCECRFSDPVCEHFRNETNREVKRILNEYLAVFCPKCKKEMENYHPAEIIENESEVVVSEESEFPTGQATFSTVQKTKVEPCGCLLDEPKKLGAIDRKQLDKDARNGELVWNYEGEATRGTDPLEKFDVDNQTE